MPWMTWQSAPQANSQAIRNWDDRLDGHPAAQRNFGRLDKDSDRGLKKFKKVLPQGGIAPRTINRILLSLGTSTSRQLLSKTLVESFVLAKVLKCTSEALSNLLTFVLHQII